MEIGKFFPNSKTCSCCGYVIDELTLDIREWDCPSCNTHHDRDGNAALNIKNEGIRILSMGGGWIWATALTFECVTFDFPEGVTFDFPEGVTEKEKDTSP
ncbi:transposase (plasmid) [Scytonema sp. HK-05]|nr:transposase [Scytonema sp. HK-05]